jgi:hypothetical protein
MAAPAALCLTFSRPLAPLDCVYNGRFRDEFLNSERFATVAEAQAFAERWRWE